VVVVVVVVVGAGVVGAGVVDTPSSRYEVVVVVAVVVSRGASVGIPEIGGGRSSWQPKHSSQVPPSSLHVMFQPTSSASPVQRSGQDDPGKSDPEIGGSDIGGPDIPGKSDPEIGGSSIGGPDIPGKSDPEIGGSSIGGPDIGSVAFASIEHPSLHASLLINMLKPSFL